MIEQILMENAMADPLTSDQHKINELIRASNSQALKQEKMEEAVRYMASNTRGSTWISADGKSGGVTDVKGEVDLILK